MAATTTPSTADLLTKLRTDYPKLSFSASQDFSWDPSTHTVLYDPADPFVSARLLHEIAHAYLEHVDFERDIDLIAMERDAWQHAKTELSLTYGVPVDPDLIHDDMDTYRDWMHARSTCPNCQASGIETKKRTYTCVNCRHVWRVNEARTCGLKRTSLQK